jgi:hypothetical protein
MDVLNEKAAKQKTLSFFDRRESIKKYLTEIRQKLLEQLDSVSKSIKACRSRPQ